MPPITLPKQTRTDAIASLRRYAEANLPEPLNELPATLLLDFFLEEIAPAVYNQVSTTLDFNSPSASPTSPAICITTSSNTGPTTPPNAAANA